MEVWLASSSCCVTYPQIQKAREGLLYCTVLYCIALTEKTTRASSLLTFFEHQECAMHHLVTIHI